MSRTIRFLGDIHGNTKILRRAATSANPPQELIQVGDFGIGFIYGNSIDHTPPNKNIKYIRGNHDNPDLCPYDPNWIADGTVSDDIMFVGGAGSIDKQWRTPGVSWWWNEELSESDFMKVLQIYKENKPRIMVTHEVPDSIADKICEQRKSKKLDIPSITREYFDIMLEYHKPELWISGHWHVQFDQNVNGTRFIVLDIDEYMDIDVHSNNLEVLNKFYVN